MFFKNDLTNKRENSVDEVRQLLWGEQNGEEAAKLKAEVYEKFLFWKRNLFMLPTGAVEKSCTTAPIKKLAFNTICVMLSLLLQKPSKI